MTEIIEPHGALLGELAVGAGDVLHLQQVITAIHGPTPCWVVAELLVDESVIATSGAVLLMGPGLYAFPFRPSLLLPRQTYAMRYRTLDGRAVELHPAPGEQP